MIEDAEDDLFAVERAQRRDAEVDVLAVLGLDAEAAVLGPAGGFELTIDRFQRGKGSVEFIRSTWEQLPTMYQVVNGLADLPVVEVRGATLLQARGAKDLSDQRVLR